MVDAVLYSHVVSAILGSVVFVLYCSYRHTRKHPSSFVFWQSCFEIMFSITNIAFDLVSGGGKHCISHDCQEICQRVGPLSLFFLLSSIGWYVWMAVDLVVSIRNPFYFSENLIPGYHIVTYGLGAAAAITLAAAQELVAYRQDLGMCWPVDRGGHINPLTWIVLFIPIGVSVTFSLIVLIYSGCRLMGADNSTANTDTMKFHSRHIRIMTRYNCTFTLYWVLAGSLYAVINFQEDDAHPTIQVVFPIVVAMRGALLALTWMINQDVLRGILHLNRGACEHDALKYSDIKQAMRAEIMPFLLQGIKGLDTTYQEQKQELHDDAIASTSSSRRLRFDPHKEVVFRQIRSLLGVKLGKLNGIKQEKSKDGGKTDAFMYWTDESPSQFIFKTMTKTEKEVLEGICADYAQFLAENPKSLLPKIVGCFSIHFDSQEITFMMMKNILATDKKLHQLFDLKGSTVDRTVKDPTKSVLKDNDLRAQGSLHFHPITRRAFLEQIDQDTEFLHRNNIMDYSLLLGVHKSFIYVPAPEPPSMSAVLFESGVPAQKIEGPAYFIFGVVDVLQKWVLKKKFERFFKVNFRRASSTGLSSQEPGFYKRRFVDAMAAYTAEEQEQSLTTLHSSSHDGVAAPLLDGCKQDKV